MYTVKQVLSYSNICLLVSRWPQFGIPLPKLIFRQSESIAAFFLLLFGLNVFTELATSETLLSYTLFLQNYGLTNL